ncbi:MAG: hypothetical protein ACLQHF_11835 [Terracidiphilus sp.]
MSSETANVAIAEAELRRARAAQAEQRRNELTENLRLVRAELRVKQPELAELKVRVFNQQAAEDNLRRKIVSRQESIASLHAERPIIAYVLSDDPDVVHWREALEAREAEVLLLQEELRAMPNLMQMRLAGVELTQRVQALEHAQVNLVNALSATGTQEVWGGRAVEGGISGVF